MYYTSKLTLETEYICVEWIDPSIESTPCQPWLSNQTQKLRAGKLEKLMEPGSYILRQAFGDPRRGVPRSDELEEILLASIRLCGMVYLFIDALDKYLNDWDAR